MGICAAVSYTHLDVYKRQVCEGLADEYPRFAPTMEWDTAAGHAIAKASGAEIYQAGQKEPLKYNKPDLLNPWFVVKRN